MALNLNDLRPATAYRIASSIFAVFFIVSTWGVTYGIRYCMYDFGKTGLPMAMDAFNIVFAFVGAAVGFSVAARFFLYALQTDVRKVPGRGPGR